jgi:LacI family transcriptional regulator
MLRRDGRGQLSTTIRQVAAAAGVSIATASRALSGSSAVIEDTRRRVLQVATELDYTPSRLARSLATGLTGNVGVIVPDLTNPFFAPFLAELESTLGARDVGLLIGDSRESPEHEQDLVRRMSTQVDGLVLASSRLSDEQIVQATRRWPVVLVNRRLGPAVQRPDRLAQVVLDVGPGFDAAVRHLHALGHRRVTYLDGPALSWSAAQKRAALERVCMEVGVRLTVVATARPDFAAGREVGRRILTTADPPATAVLTYNDQVALGVLAAGYDVGVEVPAQLSVVGCDDSLPEGLARPALTTIDCSSKTLGALAAAAIMGRPADAADIVPTRLVRRESTAPPSAAGYTFDAAFC